MINIFFINPINSIRIGILSANLLERWYEFGRIDWASELEYPEWTTKEVNRFLNLN